MNEETAALDHYSIKLLIIKEIPLLLLKLLLWRLNSTRFLGVHVTDNLLQCQSSPAPALPTEAKKDSSQPIGLHHFLQSHRRECCISLQHESSSVSERTALTRLSGSHCHHLGIWQRNAALHGQKGSWRSSLTRSLAVFPPAFRQKVSQYNVNLPNCHQTGKFIMYIINGCSTIT